MICQKYAVGWDAPSPMSTHSTDVSSTPSSQDSAIAPEPSPVYFPFRTTHSLCC